ncbi:inositol 2-dehydrogenase [Metabacillus idriensis]|uniref:inositol 2-dehydrogenase n=1 Tax=Metabacillus idriensis TaxID=324768 RepID=UPI00174CD3A1|nr:inositol 2-dehydrogenase [Metabacillus idriensis]
MSKLTIGIIGIGRIGKLHVENLLRHPLVTVKSISDVMAESLKEWASSAGISHVTNDYQELLIDSEIDAVFICSPTSTHTDIIKEAAKAGKHIFCEKPISLTYDHSLNALEAVEEADVKLQVGFNRRFDHNFKKIYETVKSGTIGTPHIVKITSRDPEPPSEQYIQTSGGMFMDMSIHDFDMARYVTGSEVEEVYVQGASLIDPVFSEYGDTDTAVMTLKFSNGAIGVIDNSRKAVYGYDQRVEVFGSLGSAAVQNDVPTTIEISTSEGVYRDKPKHFFLERYQDSYVQEINAFIESILSDSPIACSGLDGLKAEQIAKAAKESYETGKPVKLESGIQVKR